MLTPEERERIWWANYLDTRDRDPLEIARAVVPTATEEDTREATKGFRGIIAVDRVRRMIKNGSIRHVMRKPIPEEWD